MGEDWEILTWILALTLGSLPKEILVFGRGILTEGAEAGVNDLSHPECSRAGNAGFVKTPKACSFL